jgi:hypothetical protein
MRHFRLFRVAALMSILLSGAAVAQSAEDPPQYDLQLVYLFDGPETEFLFVIGNTGFRSVAALREFLASRPAGTTLRWSPGCIRMGGEPLLSSDSEMDEFREFCREHGIEFVLVPSG